MFYITCFILLYIKIQMFNKDIYKPLLQYIQSSKKKSSNDAYDIRDNKLNANQVSDALKIILTDKKNISISKILSQLTNQLLFSNLITNLQRFKAFENIKINTAYELFNHGKHFIEKESKCEHLRQFFKFLSTTINQWKTNNEQYDNDQNNIYDKSKSQTKLNTTLAKLLLPYGNQKVVFEMQLCPNKLDVYYSVKNDKEEEIKSDNNNDGINSPEKEIQESDNNDGINSPEKEEEEMKSDNNDDDNNLQKENTELISPPNTKYTKKRRLNSSKKKLLNAINSNDTNNIEHKIMNDITDNDTIMADLNTENNTNNSQINIKSKPINNTNDNDTNNTNNTINKNNKTDNTIDNNKTNKISENNKTNNKTNNKKKNDNNPNDSEMVMTITNNNRKRNTVDVSSDEDDEIENNNEPPLKKQKMNDNDYVIFNLFNFLIKQIDNTNPHPINTKPKQIDYVFNLINQYIKTQEMNSENITIYLASSNLYLQLQQFTKNKNTTKMTNWAKFTDLNLKKSKLKQKDINKIKKVFKDEFMFSDLDESMLDILIIPMEYENKCIFMLCLFEEIKIKKVIQSEIIKFIPISTEISQYIDQPTAFNTQAMLIQNSLMLAQFGVQLFKKGRPVIHPFEFKWTSRLKSNKPNGNEKQSMLSTFYLILKIIDKILNLSIDSLSTDNIIDIVQDLTWDDINEISDLQKIITKLEND